MSVHPIGAFVAIFNSHGRILMVRQTYGKCGWSLPGGVVEPGETAIEAGFREVREETGLVVRIVCELGSNLKFTKGDDVYPVRLFVSDPTDSAAAPDGIEVSACEWFLLSELPEDTYPAQRRLIERVASAR